ncbi:hypothetical protein L291_0251 [Acinetobacter guillouiae MSP4-18]|jgi:hypothetical protein|uniref:hypothetical protein n=1 Tax=Acinetobacter guillouiae TaxID=106649 RepID=UPI0002CE7BD6|nr:hypothetical protein [Acinetobacter guillouiae]ENU57364.1 hypothetical protein F981_03592 [Acinetobacter guillouiae CIP 63.46]EPH37560.1 hypothetical protein L291_0251 [Acinetobacter guillouiae MSP4-18]
MSPEVMESIALEITKIRMKKKSDADFMYEDDDAFNWAITYALALEHVKDAANKINFND